MSEHQQLEPLFPYSPDHASRAVEVHARDEVVPEPLPSSEATGGGEVPIVGAVLAAWKRRWLLATVCGAVLAAAVAPPIWHLRPAKTTVFTLLRVSTTEGSVLGDKGNAGDAQWALYRQTQVAMATARPTILSALRQEKVRNLGVITEQEDPAAWLERNLHVGFIGETELLRIEMTGERPDELSVIVSAVEHVFLQEVVKVEQHQRLLRLAEIQKVCLALEEKISTQIRAFRQRATSLNTTHNLALTSRQKNFLDEYAMLTRQLIDTRARMRQLVKTLELHKARAEDAEKKPVPKELINEALEENKAVQKSAEAVAKVEEHYEEMKDKARPGNPAINQAKKALDTAYKEHQKLLDQLQPGIEKKLRKKIAAQARAKADDTQDELTISGQMEKELQSQVEQKSTEADTIGIPSIELHLKRGEMDHTEGLLASLRSERARLEIEVQSSSRRVIPLTQDGEVYQFKNTKSRAAAAAMGGGFAFLVASLLVAGWDVSRRRVHTCDEVNRGLGLKVLASLPHLPASGRASAKGEVATEHDLWEERICGLRTALLLAGVRPPSILMVTSAGAREGKTTLATHLAASIAGTGRKTLLVDCDLRRPVLHQVFGTERGPGLSEVLRGEAEVAAAIQATSVRGLSLLPAGHVDREALGALTRDVTRLLFESLKGEYDWIIVDTSPVLPVSDALLVGQHAEGVLLAVRPTISRVPRVRAATERLKSLNKRFFWAVVTGGHEHVDADEYKYLRR